MVIIKDMEMPKCCKDCDLYIENFMMVKKVCGLTQTSGKRIDNFNDKTQRMPDCRLEEIKNE